MFKVVYNTFFYSLFSGFHEKKSTKQRLSFLKRYIFRNSIFVIIFSFLIFGSIRCSKNNDDSTNQSPPTLNPIAKPEETPLVCTGGQIAQNNQCVCVGGQIFKNNQCVCTIGQILNSEGVCTQATGGMDANSNGLIEIATTLQLDNIRNALDGKWYSVLGSAPITTGCPNKICRGYELVKDLDLGGLNWKFLGDGVANFTATFDGQGFSIKNMSVSSSSIELGLFGVTSSTALIQNLALLNVKVQGSSNNSAIGALVGTNSAVIKNVLVARGWVSASGARSFVGGLIGNNARAISNSYVYGLRVISNSSPVGGFVGKSTASLTNIFSTTTLDSPTLCVGIAAELDDSSKIQNSFFSGSFGNLYPTASKFIFVGPVNHQSGTGATLDNDFYLNSLRNGNNFGGSPSIQGCDTVTACIPKEGNLLNTLSASELKWSTNDWDFNSFSSFGYRPLKTTQGEVISGQR